MVLGAAFRPPMVGLDIGSSAVKAVVLRRGRGGWSLVAAGEAPLPDGSLQDGAAAEPTAVSEAVSELLDSPPAPARPGRRRAVRARRHRQAAVAAGDEPGGAERGDSLGGRAVHPVRPLGSPARLPGRRTTATTRPRTRSTCCSWRPRSDRIDDRTAIIAQTGRQPGRARHRGLRARQRLSDELSGARPTRCRRSFTSGRGVTIVCLLEQGRAGVHARHLDRRPDSPRVARARTRPERRRRAGGQAHPARPVPDGHEPRPGRVGAARGQRAARARGSQDRRLLPRDGAGREAVSRVVLSGGAYQAVGLVDLLAERIRRAGGRVRSVPARDASEPGAWARTWPGPAYAVAVGLAMRQEGDR